MTNPPRSIFRKDAVRRYLEGREKSILPRLVSPRTFIYLWFLLGLLGMSSIIAWFTKVPMYASGKAIIVRSSNQRIVVATFFEPQHLSSLRKTKKLFLNFADRGARTAAIITVQPEIFSPDTIQKRFAIAQITRPSAIAIAQLEPIDKNLPASAYLGSVGHAQAEVGSQRLISLLPLIGQFFEQ
ncbi:hypothetical protein [Nostoc sp. 106C]|jgi:hypothetical protein|uniref:hypothetical protein n=1 Tax=Nostoc sp. 106C TaxID=1932667 RepID=UPI000A3D01FF|nr:hypothetical protein [Nostoc sp. 106C]OUL21113.1 hypothetical protein BV378_28115 [Nostoc sp. RF31YmG]OUL35958.1 hypothetical protein BV375_01080 [Nostoc sp. 106C]